MSETDFDEMMSGAASLEEARLFHEIAQNWMLRGTGITRVGFRFGEDFDGEPVVWIRVFVEDDLNPSDAKVEELYRITRSFQDDVWRSDTNRWPLVKIETE